jgi:putative inorganic carbon (HCO3(-)) transporter
MPLRAVFLIIFIAASLPICFFRPAYGVVVWIGLAFLNPQSYTWTAFDAFPWAAAVAAPTLAGMLLFDHRWKQLASRTFLFLVILWLWFSVTTVVSTNTAAFVHHSADTWARWKFVTKILVMTACMVAVVSSFSRLRRLVLSVAACFAFYVVKSFPFIVATGGAFRLYGPDRSMIADNNDFGLALNMTLPLYFFLAQTESRRWVKACFACLFVITIPAIFFTYSRGALVGLAAVGSAMLLQSRRRFALLPILAVGIAIGISIAPGTWRDRMDPTRSDAIDASALARLNSWGFARALAADYPVTGGGFDTFTSELYEQYSPRDLGTIWGPHSVYFQVLAEHGYVGLALYLVLVGSCFAATRKIYKLARARGDTVIAGYSQMFKFSLIGFLSAGVFLGRAYFDYFFTIVGCVIVLEHISLERWRHDVNEMGETAVHPRRSASAFEPAASMPVHRA